MTDERARGYHRRQLGLSVLAFALGVAYLSSWLVTGGSARRAARIAEWTARPWLALAAAARARRGLRLLTLPLAWLGGFRLPRRFGLLHQPFARWPWDAVKAGAIGGALALAGVRSSTRCCARPPGGGSAPRLIPPRPFLLALAAPVWLVPLFYRLTPLPDGELRERLLAARRGEPAFRCSASGSRDQSRKSRTANAAVVGLGRTRRDPPLRHAAARVRPRTRSRRCSLTSWPTRRTAISAAGSPSRARSPSPRSGSPTTARGRCGAPRPRGTRGPRRPAALRSRAAGRRPGRAAPRQWLVAPRRAPGRRLRAAAAGNPPRLHRGDGAAGALNLAEREPHRLKELLLYSHPAIGARVAGPGARGRVSSADTVPCRACFSADVRRPVHFANISLFQ